MGLLEFLVIVVVGFFVCSRVKIKKEKELKNNELKKKIRD